MTAHTVLVSFEFCLLLFKLFVCVYLLKIIEIDVYRYRIGSRDAHKTQRLRSHCTSAAESNVWLFSGKSDLDSCLNPNTFNLKLFVIIYLIYVTYSTAIGMGILIDISTATSSGAAACDYSYLNLTSPVSSKLAPYTKLLSAILTCYVLLLNISHNGSLNSLKYSLTLKSNKYPIRIFNKCTKRITATIVHVVVWLHILNLLLVVISNPSMLNPGPNSINSLNIMHQNVQGLIPLSSLNDKNPLLNITKILELQSHIYLTKPDLIILNETWLKPSIADSEILPSGYNIFRMDRSNYTHPIDATHPKKFRKNGGGVLIAARCDFGMTVNQIGLKLPAAIISIELTNPNGQKAIICTLYRVGTLGMSHYTKVQTYLQTLVRHRGISNFSLIGDLNLSKTNWNTLESTCAVEQCFVDMFSDLGLTQLVNQPTHNKGNTLDVVLTNFPCNISNLKVLDRDYICKSDHHGITFQVKAKAKREKSIKREIYNFKKANWTKLNENLSNLNWRRLLHTNNSIEHTWKIFKQTLIENINKHILKIKICSEFQPPWFDSETYELCRQKERLRAKFKSDQSKESYMKFSNCRRELKNLVKEKMNNNFCDDNDYDFIKKNFGRTSKNLIIHTEYQIG